MGRSLNEWLEYQQQIHHQGVDLGLDRVREVWLRLDAPRAPLHLIVGGTNGKGSTVAFADAMLRAAGHRSGTYTSPHLIAYNERVCVDGEPVGDEVLCTAFERIEQARGELSLTYFEFGTLAALEVFARHGVEVAVMEVGLGGRLDATNIVDADAAVITTVAMDHMDWLGDDRDSIGREKAAIARPGRPVMIGDAAPPAGLLDALHAIGARLQRIGIDFDAVVGDGDWEWRHADGTRLRLPLPVLEAPCQIANAAAAIAALHALGARLPVPEAAVARGVREARISGRLQHLRRRPDLVVDVAHNPQAAQELARWLRAQPAGGRTLAVFGALADKDVAGVVETLRGDIDVWYLAGLDSATARGLPAPALEQALRGHLPSRIPLHPHADVDSALAAALEAAAPADRIIAFGSFFVVSPVLERCGVDDAAADRPA